MPPAPVARIKVLYAYAEILADGGERAATLDAVAKRAGVSKGGLLYHFASKKALADGLAAYLDELVADDVETMRTYPDGPVAYLLRTSHHLDERFELIYQGVVGLAMRAQPAAQASIAATYRTWQQVLVDAGADRATAATILLIADGLSVRSVALGAEGSEGRGGVGIEEIVRVAQDVDGLRRRR